MYAMILLIILNEAQNIALGAEVFAVSNVTGEGIEALTSLLKDGKTAALLGSSGVGKSSLTNAICGDEFDGHTRYSGR